MCTGALSIERNRLKLSLVTQAVVQVARGINQQIFANSCAYPVRSGLINLNFAQDWLLLYAWVPEIIELKRTFVEVDNHLHRSNIGYCSLLVIIARARDSVLITAQKRFFDTTRNELDIQRAKVIICCLCAPKFNASALPVNAHQTTCCLQFIQSAVRAFLGSVESGEIIVGARCHRYFARAFLTINYLSVLRKPFDEAGIVADFASHIILNSKSHHELFTISLEHVVITKSITLDECVDGRAPLQNQWLQLENRKEKSQ